MIGKLTNKDKIALLYITLLTLFAVIYGFSIIPSPLKQQILANDEQRVVDLGKIQSSVDNYYQTNNTLPKSLNDVNNTYDPSTQLNLTDPATKQPYEYTILDATSYQLCATFTHSTLNENPAYTDPTSNIAEYPSFSYQFKHSEGHYCFTKREFTPSFYNNYPPKTQPIYKYKTASPSSYGGKTRGK